MVDYSWGEPLGQDIEFGLLRQGAGVPRRHNPTMILNDSDGTMFHALRENLKRSDEFDFSVAFVSSSAIAMLKQDLLDFSGRGRITTSNYLNFNSPEAFAELLVLKDLGIDIRISQEDGFHPKGYVFREGAIWTAMVGSSNLTATALVKNVEWNLRISARDESDLARQLRNLVQQGESTTVALTQGWIDQYAESYVLPRLPSPSVPIPVVPGPVIIANTMQSAALNAIQGARNEGATKAIIVSATGTGKTILSALDVREMQPNRFLFVVHREQILDRTIVEYQKVLGGSRADFGKLSGSSKQTDCRYLFATVQTLSRADVLFQFSREHFDYIIFDEAHRAGAASHRSVLEHFRPEFLLGMTATPERTDEFNVFELFDYNVPYEIRLNDALEADMLSPFHYYGVADLTEHEELLSDGRPALSFLSSQERVHHIIEKLEIYTQAGVPPRGLIYCSRLDEAHALSEELNQRTLRGRTLRTVALTGKDPVDVRNAVVRQLEAGHLDYILTVDIFNEGIDIPSVNQVIMLRQTKSAIVFVQQLGRGLRKAPGKDHLIVLDFIGNYANNFLIPIALFGDESLNKESLRKNLVSAEESGMVGGLSSIHFDKIAQERVLRAITETKLDSMQHLKTAVRSMHDRLGRVPRLADFHRFESVDPVLLATKRHNYPMLLSALLKAGSGLTPREHRMLSLVSQEVFPAKRLHEFVLLKLLDQEGETDLAVIADRLETASISADVATVDSAVATFTLSGHSAVDRKRYQEPIASVADGSVRLSAEFIGSYRSSSEFRSHIDDLVETGQRMVVDRYDVRNRFTPGSQYSRKEVTRLLNWPRNWTSTLYGYKVDRESGHCPIFVTLHKADDITDSTAYDDKLLDPSTMYWFTRSRRTLQSNEVRAIVDREVDLHVFVKKDDAEGTDLYYLGDAQPSNAQQTTMAGPNGTQLDVVTMLLRFERPMDFNLFNYFHPTLTV